MAAPLAVALLGRADETRAQLRRALEDLGAQIVFEGDPAGLKPDQVLRSAPKVVLVNLESGVEDDIDHLQALFDSPNVNVVFNEAEVTRQLEGWDLARWARHLAAKIMGREPTNPPPPPGSEPLPVRNLIPTPGAPPKPEQFTVDRPIEEFMIEAEGRVEDVPSDHLPYVTSRKPPVMDEPAPDFRIDTSEVESALKNLDVPPAVEQTVVPEPEVPELLVHEDEAAEFDVSLDMAALDKALEMGHTPPPKAEKSDAALLDEALAGLDMSVDVSDFEADAEVNELSNTDSVKPVSLAGSGELDFEAIENSGELDDDVAALAAQLDALAASPAPRNEVKDLDFGAFDAPSEKPSEKPSAPATKSAPAAPAAPIAKSAPAAAAPAAPAKKPSFGDLDLTPFDEAPAPAAPAAKKESKFDFGSLNFSLEPTDEEGSAAPAPPAPAPAKAPVKAPSAPAFDLSGLSLEPSEEDLAAIPGPSAPAAAPAALEEPEEEAPSDSDLDALFAAMDLAPTKGGAGASSQVMPLATGAISRVIVLGASIGGPDAVRTFLAGIPPGFPALFVLAQHLENGFFERLAQQLQKASKLPVRVPEPGSKDATLGEVLVVSAKQRVVVEPSGAVNFSAHTAPPKYTPCIDDVLRDVADRFGARTTAIIFSGMAGDAIDGAVYVTSKGGKVWAQDPATCIVSSMVDGARSRGVVEYTASPGELSMRLVEQYGEG